MKAMLEAFNVRFGQVDSRSRFLLAHISDDVLYARPRELPHSLAMFSCGEYILRSGAAVEQTFAGLSTRLWDDPFEWSLPEKLNTVKKVLDYLDEVARTRSKAMSFFKSDEELVRQIPSPETIRPIFDLMLETVARSEHYQGRASAVFQYFSDTKLPRI